ncbi:MAG: hypothetical protein IPJ69_10915 [Deltaproteobacteria bacterium]|nr:MAG: hypothetical protein IPJ69_10915 [Deltaproteobacteria bacterium]
MNLKTLTSTAIKKLLDKAERYPLTTINYPSRGQTAVQEIYQTKYGKFFLKRNSKQNHIDCQIDIDSGTLAEREFWAFQLAEHLGLDVPRLWLLDKMTTVQVWLDYPDAKQYSSTQERVFLNTQNVFECGLFDWLTGQIDRHNANYLYDYVSQKIILIDSAHCFLKHSASLPHYLEFFEGAYTQLLSLKLNTKLSQKIKSIKPKQLDQLIVLRNEDEKKALHFRMDSIKKTHTISDLINLYRRKS